MTHHTVDDVLKGLAAELDIEVAPEFAARVRVAVDAQRPTARGWIWGVVGVGAAALVALAVVMSRPAAVPDIPARASFVAAPSTVTRSTAKADLDSRPAGVPATPVRDTPTRQTRVGAATEQAVALDRLLLGLRSGRTTVPAETRAPLDLDGLLLAPEPISIRLIQITPVEIQPLPAIELLQPWGERR